MKRLLRVCGALLGVASASYFAVFAYRALSRGQGPAMWSARMITATALAAVGYACVIPTSAWAWGRLLRSMGVAVPTPQLRMILGMTQIAKYVPGNIAQHVGRSAMSLRRGIPVGPLLVTLATETFVAIAAAAAVGALGLGLYRGATASTSIVTMLAAVGAASGVGLAAIRGTPAALRRVVPRLAVGLAHNTPAGGALATAFVAYACNFLILGLGLFAVAWAAFRPPALTLPLFIGSMSLAWIAGFVTPGAPAGLGVREGAMAALLAPTLPSPTALEIIVAFRVATTLGDLLGLAWGGILYFEERRSTARRRAPHRS